MNIAASAPRRVGGVRRRVGSCWRRFRVRDSAPRWSGSATTPPNSMTRQDLIRRSYQRLCGKA
jgi:hypothetical protein